MGLVINSLTANPSLKPSMEYLFNGEIDVIVEFLLRVNSLRAVVPIALQEEVFKRGCILLLERHHHLVTEPKQHQLSDSEGEKRGRGGAKGSQQGVTSSLTEWHHQ